MNKKLELMKNTLIIFFGKFCTQFISFLLVPIYTYFLTTKDYGYIDLVQTYFALLVPIILLRIDSAVFRFLIDCRKDEKEKRKVIASSFYAVILQMFLGTILFIISSAFVKYDYFLAILINIIMISLSSYFLQVSRGIGDNISYSISSIISGILTIFFNILFLIIFKKNGEYVLYASSIANFGCVIYLFFKLKILKYLSCNYFDKKSYKGMIKYSLPMIPDGLSWWIMNVSDRTIVSLIIDVSANGIYAVASKFSNIVSSMFQIFNMSWQESASLHVNDKDKDEFFTAILNSIYKIMFSLCILILGFMPLFFTFFIGKEYIKSMMHIPILLYGNIFSAIANFIGGIYIANKKTKSVAKTTIISSIINIIINLCLIKYLGLYAASISTLVSYIALCIYRYIDSKKYAKLSIDKKIIYQTTIIYIIMISIYYWISNFYIKILYFLISIYYVVFLNKRELYNLLNKLKERRNLT